MTRLARFLSLYVDQAARTVDIHVQRIGTNGHTQTGRYTLHEGEPSIDRLWALIRDRKHTDHPAQQGWGVTPTNWRAHSVYAFDDLTDTEYEKALSRASELMDAPCGSPEESELDILASRIVKYERRFID